MPTKSKRSRKHSKRASAGPVRKGSEQHQINLEPESPTIRDIESEQRVRWGFHTGICCLAGSGLLALGHVTWREAFDKNPKFALREVVVNTKGWITPEKIVRTAGVTEGQNVMDVDLLRVQKRINDLPAVRSTSVVRGFDGKLTLDVEQRDPVAWIECPKQKLVPFKEGTGCMVDRRGVALPCEVMHDEFKSLPVIHLDELGNVAPGADIASDEVKAALKLLALMARQGAEKKEAVTITRIDIPKAFSLVTTFADGAKVIFGADGLGEQLARYKRIRTEEGKRGWQIATMNLLAEDNIPVTFKNVASVPADVPRRVTGGRAGDRTVARRN